MSADLAVKQADVDAAWQALMKEIHKLGFVCGDKTSLGKLIEVADGYNAEINLYTPATAAAFVPVLEAAKTVCRDENAMQDQVTAGTSTNKTAN